MVILFFIPFIVRFPALEVFPYTFILIPLLLSSFSFLFSLYKGKIAIDWVSILILFSFVFSFFTLIIGNTILLLPISLSVSILLSILMGRYFLDGIFHIFFCKRHATTTKTFVRLIFLIIPISIILQRFIPQLFSYYNLIIDYGTERTEKLNITGQRTSGLLDLTGTAGSLVIVANLILLIIYECFQCKNIFTLRTKMIIVIEWIIFFIAASMTGSFGLILLFCFTSGFYFALKSPLLKVHFFYYILLMLFTFASILFISSTNSISGLKYFNALLNYGLDGMLNSASFYVLIQFYSSFFTNLEFAVQQGGFFGASSAKSLFDLTDIGIINEIYVLGLFNFINYNLFLLIFLIKSFNFLLRDYNAVIRRIIHAGIFSIGLSMFILQFKEFSFFSNSLILLLIVFYLLDKFLGRVKSSLI